MPDQMLRCRLHRFNIKWSANMPDAALFQRRRCPAVNDAVDVQFTLGAKARMKIIARGLGARHRHGARQMRIDGFGEGRPIQRPLAVIQIHMRHLAIGMDARIRAARDRDRQALLAKTEDGVFNRLLHGRNIALLPLPAAKGLAVIFNGKFPACHNRKL